MKVKEIYCSDIEKRREFIKKSLENEGIAYKVQEFNDNGYKGENILISKWVKENHFNIVISSHYDGPGAYDNTGGVVSLFWIIKWAKLDGLSAINNCGIIPVFTDAEERNLAGIRNLLKCGILNGIKIVGHISIDGFGIGTGIGYFSNLRKVRLRVNGEEKLFLVRAENVIFQKNGIPSINIFSLPEEELEGLIRYRVFPSLWKIIHTEEDAPTKIDEDILPFLSFQIYKKLSKVKFNKKGVFSLNGK